MSLFDDANRRLSATTELCYAATTLAMQAYNAVLSDSEIRIKFLASDKQQRQKKRANKVVALGNPSKLNGCRNHALKQKLNREHHLKGALRNQSNKHQNSQKPMLKAEKKYQLHA